MDADNSSSWPFLAEGGEMGRLIRGHDWSATALGLPSTWPQPLRSVVSACLNSPMLGAVLWGPDLLMIYNDTYMASLAERHPAALGRPIHDVWGETWEQVAAPFHQAMSTGVGFAQTGVELPMMRHGKLETTWWNFTAAPIRDEDGRVVGLLNQGVEITEQVRAEAGLRSAAARQGFLVELGDLLLRTSDAREAITAAVRMLRRHLGAQRAGYGEVEADNATILLGACDAEGVSPLEGRFALDGFGLETVANQRSGQSVWSDDVERDPRHRSAMWAAIDTSAFASVPLVRNERLAACLYVTFAQPHGWTEDEVTLVKDVASRIWAAGERARAEERLRASEEFTRRILQSSADCIKVLDLDGKLAFMSEGGQEVMEVSDFSAIRGCPWPDFWNGPGHQQVHDALATARAGGTGHFRGPADTLAGSPRFWDVQVTPILGADGRPERILSVSRDITAMYNAERALRDSEAHWRGLFEHLQEGIIIGELIRDPAGAVVDWRYLDVNPAWGALVGLATDGAIGRSVREIFPSIEDRWVAEMAEVVETGRPAQFLRQIGAIGRWYEGRAFSLADDRFAMLFVEVTDRKGAEDRRNAVLELDDRLCDVTEPAEMAFAAAEIVGRVLAVARVGYGTMIDGGRTILVDQDWAAPGVASVAGRHDMRSFGSYFEALAQGQLAVVDDTASDNRANATSLATLGIRALVNLPLMEQGQSVAVFFVNSAAPRHWTGDEISFMRNVAERTRSAIERRRAEQALRAFAASLEQQMEERTRELMATEEALRQSQKMEAVGQLTGGLAHDFNNLLTGVTGSLELLQTRIAQGRIKDVDRYVNAAQGAAKRAAALTHRLLAFSRRQTLDPKPTNVKRLVQGMEDLVQRTVGPAIAVETVMAGGLWTTLVDAGQLENALLNLCINARDAMPDGGKITVETANRWLDERTARERDLNPGQYVSLCVSDTGTGMSPEVTARAFDPFFTTKPIGMGTGLGLSMIYGFARQSGGQARIYSELGQGTMVCLYLPRHFGEASSADLAPELADAPRAAAGDTVLVVDDEPTVRMLVTEVLEDLGYTAIEAADGAGGLKVLQSDVRIDLLVTDVGLPGGLNGRQMADAARALRPELKVLFITGYAENAVLSHGYLEAGMHVLTKPFAMEALASRIKALVSP